nr:helix-turn-helix domain-containing protein [Escherichia coli]
MKRLQAFKFQLRPGGQQEREMRRFAGACRFVFNRALAHRITSPWKWRHLKSVIVPSVQSPPSMLKLHDFCNRAS